MTPVAFRAERDGLGLTAAALAREMGITERHLTRLEAGVTPISQAMVNNLEGVKARRAAAGAP